jgi:ribonuclease G
VSERDLKADMDFLIKLWNEVVRRTESSRCPALIYNDLDLLLRTVRDLFTADVEKLIIDSRSEYDRSRSSSRRSCRTSPAYRALRRLGADLRRLRHRDRDRSGARAQGLAQVRRLPHRRRDGGAHRHRRQHRPLRGKKSLEDTITQTNLEASREVAEQLRIRSIGGMIVVDFIDMDRPSNRDKVMRAFNEFLRKDRAKAAVTRISELGSWR